MRRARKIRFQAYDLEGNLVEYEADELFSRAVQHETDHLDGKLIIDYFEPLVLRETRRRSCASSSSSTGRRRPAASSPRTTRSSSSSPRCRRPAADRRCRPHTRLIGQLARCGDRVHATMGSSDPTHHAGNGRLRSADVRAPDRAPGIDVVALVTQPDRPQGRKQEIIPSLIKQISTGAWHARPAARGCQFTRKPGTDPRLAADLLVTAAYGQILSAALLSIPRLGGINLHGSILPAYRAQPRSPAPSRTEKPKPASPSSG